MAAALMGRTEVGVKEFGRDVNVDYSAKARLMYYLDCICVVLDMSDTPNLSRLRKYRQHASLTEDETDALVSLCFLLSPKTLNGKVIFQDADMCGKCSNAFYEISAVRHDILVSESIIIGGQRRRVTKIMAFTKYWLDYNWVGPMQEYSGRLARIAIGEAPPRAGGNHRPPSAPASRPSRATDNARQQPARAASARPRPTANQPNQQSTSNDSSCIIL